MKKFLSLVLALVMTMSLVTVSAGAKEFADDDTVTYDEAVNVISEIGVVDGYTDGSFKPTEGLSRGAAAKIICNLILGPTTASELHADTAPFKDVPVNNTFAGYIAYCAKEEIISGYGDGAFRPTAPLTGYAFMKMLLGALGYDSDIEGYTGANWSINVAKQAVNIGLNKGLVDEFNGVKNVNREEAALYAFNTLKADLVQYDTSLTVNSAGNLAGLSVAKAQTWNNSATRINNIKNDEYIQFAEQYFPKLVCTDDVDDFGRPANTWAFKGVEIGTYVDWSLLVEEYTAAVKYKDLFSVLTANTIDKYDLTYFVDGAETNDIVKNSLYRTNNTDATNSGRGVLTQVFVDNDTEEITITMIHTYLAKANANYNTKGETISLQVYNTANGIAKIVDAEDVPAITDLKEDDFVLVTWASDDTNAATKTIIEVMDVETLEDVTVSKFTKSTNDTSASQSSTDRVTALTTGGTEYKNNVTAWYEDATLGDYYGELLTNKTYDIYLDQYGYFIGAALHSGDDQYVFIAAYDAKTSAMGLRNSDALAIFTDGTMQEIKVNTKETNDNITASADANYSTWGGQNGVNRWFTYSEDNGVYTLTPVTRYTIQIPAAAMTVQTDNLALQVTAPYGTGRSFGNDDSVYITVEDGGNGTWDGVAGTSAVIDEITGVYTGVQDVRLSVDAGDWIAAVYDKDQYIIAAIVLGEAEGAVDNYAYILSGANSEARDDNYYYWTFKAVLNGEVQTMTIKSKYSNTIRGLTVGEVKELVLDGDGYVTKINDVPGRNVQTAYQKGVDEIYDNLELNAGTPVTDYSVYYVAGNRALLYLEGRTLHLDTQWDQKGLAFARDAKAVVSQSVNGSRSEVEYASVQEAYSILADATPDVAGTPATVGLNFNGDIVAILDANGVAQWVFFYDNTLVTSGSRPNYGNSGNVRVLAFNDQYDVVTAEDANGARIANATIVLEQLRDTGYMPVGTFTTDANGRANVPVVLNGTYRATCGNVSVVFSNIV